MKSNPEVIKIAQVLTKKSSISICLPLKPNADSVASATALYLALLEAGKNVSIALSEPYENQFGLLAEDKIQQQLINGGDNLVVSFPYEDGAVDKVTYNIEDNHFNLLIQPREGAQKLDPKKVKFSYSGGKPDAIVVIYAPTLNSLGDLYEANKEQFNGIDIINIDRHFTNSGFGTVNFVDKKASSISEMVLAVIQNLEIKMNKDIATNLYVGVATATNNFTAHSVNADTFETLAFLLHNGAVKKPVSTMGANSMGPSMGGQSFGANPFTQQFGGMSMPPMPKIQPIPQQYQPQSQPQSQPRVEQAPMTDSFADFDFDDDDFDAPDEQTPMEAPIETPIEQIEAKEQLHSGNDDDEGHDPAPVLKPNIFNKGRKLI